MFLSKCAVPDSEKSKFIKQQEACVLLRSLRIKIIFIKSSLVGPLLFYTSKLTQVKKE